MKDQSLRRVVSDAATEILDINISTCKETSLQTAAEKVAVHEVENISAECECCGLHEECTLDYFGLVKECYCGKWVCGLCSEAVKEQLKKFPDKALEEAIDTHTAFTKKFNATTRLNPTLSLAKSMTHAIKVSFRHGAAKLPLATKIARSNSCMPRIDTDHIDFKRENNRVLQ
ncbi:hypothetical protein H6P81_009107 [Aristolochia fimbriata]|uniref:Uncharacterized protein n=1 Tax=Aristolochia fimbriata TaxID=158543 RepID=A0AAV7END8_ARIFI|nr:hypothetical protein H6P81_009107 [Aristolochia fimbriata]